jgi:hypothetical protein
VRRGKKPASGAGWMSAGEEFFPHTDKAIRGPDCTENVPRERHAEDRAII